MPPSAEQNRRRVKALTITRSRFEQGRGGHYAKSRSRSVEIVGNNLLKEHGNELKVRVTDMASLQDLLLEQTAFVLERVERHARGPGHFDPSAGRCIDTPMTSP